MEATAPVPRRTLPSLLPQSGPLILHPGPIYAVDGDRGINQPIVYSIIRGEWAPAPNFSLHATPCPRPHMGRTSWDPGTSGLQRGLQPNPPAVFPGNEDGSFSIDANTGNLTVTKSIPSPKTFFLLVKVGARTGPGLHGPFLGPWLQGSPFKDLLVTAASPTPRPSRRITPDTR